MNKSYRKGYAFERRVVSQLSRLGYFVVRQGKSAFPDIIAFPTINTWSATIVGESAIKDCIVIRKPGDPVGDYYTLYSYKPAKDDVLFIECKTRAKIPANPIKMLSKEEVEKLENIYLTISNAVCLLAFPAKIKRTSYIQYYDLFDAI